MSTNNVGPATRRRKHGSARWVRTPHEMNERQKDEIRRRAGSAYLRMGAGSVEIAGVLGFRSHASVSRRMQGKDGPLAGLLMEIDRLERNGYDTTALATAVIETQMTARGSFETACLADVAMEEQQMDAAEDLAQTAFLAGKASGKEWIAALDAYVVRVMQRLPALRKAVS